MLNLTQYEYLDRDMILKGVVDWMVKESPLIGVLPMKDVQGNSLKYNVSTALPTASWSTRGTQLSENTGTFVQRTTDIYTLIQTAYTDKAAIKLNATQDPEAIDSALAAQAMAQTLERALILGRTTANTNSLEFKGLLKIIAELEGTTVTDLDATNNDQVVAMSATSNDLDMATVDLLVDTVKPGKPDLLLMSRRTRRRLNILSRASGGGVTIVDSDLFGTSMTHYDGIPIYVSDWILDNVNIGSSSAWDIAAYDEARARATNYNCTYILALQLGEDKVTGLQAGEMVHERETFIEDYNAIANRYTMLVGLAGFKKYSMAALINIVNGNN